MAPREITVLVVPAEAGSAALRAIIPDLPTLTSLVGGDLEAVRLLPGRATMYVNAEGKYAGLAPNPTADRLLAAAGVRLMPGDHVVGQVVVVGDCDRHGAQEGDEHDVPAEVLDLCARCEIPVGAPPPVT